MKTVESQIGRSEAEAPDLASVTPPADELPDRQLAFDAFDAFDSLDDMIR